MKVGNILGGLIAVIMGSLMLLQTIMLRESIGAGGNFWIAWVINLVFSILAIIGGILGFMAKRGGGICLAIGIISVILAVISTMSMDLMFVVMQFSYFGITLGIGPIWVIPIEPIFLIIAGIILLISSSNQES